MHKQECVGAIVCKLDVHRKVAKRGYIAMLAVDEKYRKRSIGKCCKIMSLKWVNICIVFYIESLFQYIPEHKMDIILSSIVRL